MRPVVLAAAMAMVVGVTTAGCGSPVDVSAPGSIPATAPATVASTTPTTSAVPATAPVDTTRFDLAAITTLWRSHTEAGRVGGWRGFYQNLAATAYPEGAWDLASITCYDRLVADNRLGQHLSVEQYLTALTSHGPPPVEVADPATIEPSPGWVLGSADATVGGGRSPSGGIYAMSLKQTPDGPPTLEAHVHVTVVAGRAYWFPFSCVDAEQAR